MEEYMTIQGFIREWTKLLGVNGLKEIKKEVKRMKSNEFRQSLKFKKDFV